MERSEALQTVWVLGAGFSKPLGGPTLADLFRERRLEQLRGMFGGLPGVASCVYHVQRLYAAGLREGLWRDAEQYLGVLDLSASGTRPGLAQHIRLLLSELAGGDPDIDVPRSGDGLSRLARRAMAAECSYFLLGTDVQSESWLPYRSWFSGLRPGDDSIINFNYDLVLERLAGGNDKYHVSLPGTEPSSKTVVILKPHGSVDWLTVGDRVAAWDAEQVLKDPEADISICTPGPRKATFAAGPFASVWQDALQRLRRTRRVVFIGYRFPESDAAARHEILSALRDNVFGAELAVHAVLGLPSKDSQRMEWLLRAVTRHSQATVVMHPVWAEDFLGLTDCCFE